MRMSHPRGKCRMAKLMLAAEQLFSSSLKTAWRGTRNYGTRRESKPWKQKPNRKARLKIVLTEDVHKLGVKGQIVEVKHGYGRNHLIPQRMAVYATHYNVKDFSAFSVEEGASKFDETEGLVNYLRNKELTVRVPPSETTVVTECHISRAFRQHLQMHVPLDCIELSNPITDFTSKNSVLVRLNKDTLITVPVTVDTSLTKKEQRKVDKRNAYLSRITDNPTT